MAQNSLVALAAAMREALASPQSLIPTTKAEHDARLDIIDMVPDLNRNLLGEMQTLRDLAWSSLNVLSLQAVHRFQIANHVPKDSSITYADLSAKTGLEELALRRLVRHAMTSHIFRESSQGHVAHTPTSLLLTEKSKIAAWVDFYTQNLFQATAHQVDAMVRWPGSPSPRETGFSISIANPGKTSLYEEVMKVPEKTVIFRDAMELFSSGEGYEVSSLVEEYDWKSLGEGLVVDVGGANGFASAAISKAFPSLKLIVQDIEMNDALKSEHQSPQIEFMAHDFFTPQPIKNADVYLYRWIFHNWSDEKSVEILRNAIPALKPGAKIIINDGCLPEPGQGRWFHEKASRNIDITMMTALNAREREEGDWEGLFVKADPRFKFLGARQPENARIWIIEAEWVGSQ